MAEKGINEHLILAATSIVLPGHNDKFQLDELSVLSLKPLQHFKEKTQLLAALVANPTCLTRRTLNALVNPDSFLNCSILKGARKNTVLLS